MEGNVVKAAWILGGSMVASVLLLGVGAFVITGAAWVKIDQFTKRAAETALEASRHTRVSFDTEQPIKVGFENKLPMSLRLENSLDESKGTRAPLVLKLNP